MLSALLLSFVLPLSAQDDVSQEGVRTLPSGLAYEILAEGSEGPHPALGDTVKVHYTGWLENGTEFDSSRGEEPAVFKLLGVIAGWKEGLQLMTPGARFKFTIPPHLAYGERGSGAIPANATLVFDVEMLEVTPGPKIPEFCAVDREKARGTDSGLAYEVVDEGAGEMPGPDDVVEFEYIWWNEQGEMIECSAAMTDMPIRVRVSDLRFPFLRETLGLLRPGGRVRCLVPPDKSLGPNTPPQLKPDEPSVWDVRLVKVHAPLPVPQFVLPADGDLVTTPSGLRYQVVKEGTGKTPRMGQQVEVHYAGWLTDGTPFDSSFARAAPATFRLGQVIAGWNEGLQLMKEGGVCRFVIPANLAYGDRPKGTIPPGSTLVFYVELISVQ